MIRRRPVGEQSCGSQSPSRGPDAGKRSQSGSGANEQDACAPYVSNSGSCGANEKARNGPWSEWKDSGAGVACKPYVSLIGKLETKALDRKEATVDLESEELAA